MPTEAKQRIEALLVNRVDLVSAPDNPLAHVALYKNDPLLSPEVLKIAETTCGSCGGDEVDGVCQSCTAKAAKCPVCSTLLPPDRVCVKCGWTRNPTPAATDQLVIGDRATKGMVWDQIVQKATIAAESGGQEITATTEQRVDAFLESDEGRALREAYASAPLDDEPTEVSKALPEPSEIEKAHVAALKAQADEGTDSRAYCIAMSQRQAALGHDLDAQRWADLAGTL